MYGWSSEDRHLPSHLLGKMELSQSGAVVEAHSGHTSPHSLLNPNLPYFPPSQDHLFTFRVLFLVSFILVVLFLWWI